MYERHRESRDRFEILALHHDKDVRTFEDLDKILRDKAGDPLAKKPLPFPVLLDAGGRTFRKYEIRVLPTQILIDPEGNVFRDDKLEPAKFLEKQLEKPRKEGLKRD